MHQRLHFLLAPDVRLDDDGTDAKLLGGRGRLLRLLAVAEVVDGNVAATRGQRQRNPTPDATPATGNDRAFAL
jgi:hypothetical protein